MSLDETPPTVGPPTLQEQLDKIILPPEEENYMIITIDYTNIFVFPYKDAMIFLSSLKNAKKYSDKYQDNERISPLNVEIKTQIIDAPKYKELCMMDLLLGPQK